MAPEPSPDSMRFLPSYDVVDAPRGRRVHVCQIVFGRTRTDPNGAARTELGFIHRPGVVWVGQSVLVLPQRDAEELATRLQGLGVRVAMGPVAIEPTILERFRRGRMA